MQQTTSKHRSFWLPFTIILLVVIALHFLQNLASLLLLCFTGILVALFLHGISNYIAKKLPIPLNILIFLVLIFVILFFIGVGWIAGPNLTSQFSSLQTVIPSALETIQTLIEKSPWADFIRIPQTEQQIAIDMRILSGVTGVFSTTAGILGSVLLVLFLGLYFSLNPDLYLRNILRLFPTRQREKMRSVYHAIGHALRWWLVGRIATMVIIGLLTTLALYIIGVPLAFLLGLIAALLCFIPYIGPILSSIPAILVALAKHPILALWVIVVYSLIQLVETYFITPLIQERTVQLPPAFLIIVQVLMGVLFGFMGILLATPLFIVAVVLVQILYVQDILGDKITLLGDHQNRR